MRHEPFHPPVRYLIAVTALGEPDFELFLSEPEFKSKLNIKKLDETQQKTSWKEI